ncbi:MAG: protein TonB [Psychromonas sp.]|jgi:protein TonB|uniref:energy transducer TonB n=1 Tax=Psychromonas sp. TaxID=1884585 RepID=UPI0039E2CF28
MKKTSSYFPFIIISLILYGFLFIYIDKPKRITILPLNSGEQAIQVQFISEPDQLKNLSEDELTQPIGQKTVASPRPEETEIQSKKIIKPPAKFSESEVKLTEQALPKSLEKSDTNNEENLKAKVSHPQPTTDEIISKQTEQLSKTQTQAEIPPVPTNSSAKKKKVVKRSPSENSSSLARGTKNQGVLQEAIVVSGRKPVYPQRAILRNQQGRVVVKLTVTQKGLPENPKILTSSGFSILDNAVLTFINQELFMPALQGEDKVNSEQLFAFRFQLN